MNRSILTRGDEKLRITCPKVTCFDAELTADVDALHQALARFRAESGFGRAIAAPQLGILKRAIALNLGATPFSLINPEITWRSEESFAVWDDCLSEPDRIVRVLRHRSISLRYQDMKGRVREWSKLNEEMSELVQHEIDHLNGVLMSDRAIDSKSIRSVSERDSLIDSERPTHRLSLSNIAAGARSIDPVFRGTPQYDCDALSQALGCELTLKVETHNPIRSFKGRGASFFIQQAIARGESRPLVCASAGNFGQAMAYVCREHSRPLVIFAAETANPLKLERMRKLGADLILDGKDFDAAKASARSYAADHHAWIVEDGQETEISEGAGSIAVELLQGDAFYDSVIVPVGNGALINGMGRWIKASSPSTRVIGVCSERAHCMEQSWLQGRGIIHEVADTIADGIAVRVPVNAAVDDMLPLVDEILLVSDTEIIQAMQLIFECSGLLVEPAGAVGVAGILASPSPFQSRRTATVLSGSNLTTLQIRKWIMANPQL